MLISFSSSAHQRYLVATPHTHPFDWGGEEKENGRRSLIVQHYLFFYPRPAYSFGEEDVVVAVKSACASSTIASKKSSLHCTAVP